MVSGSVSSGVMLYKDLLKFQWLVEGRTSYEPQIQWLRQSIVLFISWRYKLCVIVFLWALLSTRTESSHGKRKTLPYEHQKSDNTIMAYCSTGWAHPVGSWNRILCMYTMKLVFNIRSICSLVINYNNRSSFVITLWYVSEYVYKDYWKSYWCGIRYIRPKYH
jgi:hypothetical protein